MPTYNLITNLILYIVSLLNTSFLLETKLKNKLWIVIFGIPLFLLTSFLSSPLRLIIQIIILLLINCFFSKDIKKIISSITVNYFITLLTDIIITSLIFITIKEIEIIQYMNYLISFIWGLLSYLTIRQKIFIQFWNIIKNNLKEYIYMLIILTIIIFYASIIDPYTITNNNNLIFYLIFILILTISLFNLIRKTIERNKLEQETKKLLEFMKLYEQEIEQIRINRHEYKNILLCIKSMISDNNDEVLEFINDILDDNPNQNYNILKEVQKLKISPLKGLLYYQLCSCEDKGINFILNIDPKIKYQKVKKTDDKTMRNLSTIIGVLLDNAIEACLETESKSLSIYIYEEKEKLVFQISNTFKGTVNINLISKKRKPQNNKINGHGLALVNYKLKESPKLNLRTEINNDIFIQYLELNFKKNTYKEPY